MPLARSISELRKELQELVIISLPDAIKYCHELLPENTEKYNLLLQMRTNLKQLNKELFQNLISHEENSRRIAQISVAFINLVADLEAADFDPPKTSKSKNKIDTQHGSVLYHIPHSMPIGKATYCKIRVAIEEDAILEDIVIDADVRIRERIEVSERMSAELLDAEGKVFSILPLNAKDQATRPTGYTQWLFRVTPLLEGEHQLMVKVSLLAFDPNTKEYIPRDVSVLETVSVVTANQYSDDEQSVFKSTGHSFALNSDLGRDTNNVGSDSTFPFSIRNLSFLLVFLIFTFSVALSIARPLERDYFIAAYFKQNSAAFTKFIEKHKNSAPGGLKHPLIDKAYFKKAEKSRKLVDLRKYQEIYKREGNYSAEVFQKITLLERETVACIQEKPSIQGIQSYVRDFPDANYLSQVLDAAQTMPAAEQIQVLPQIEQAYVRTMEAKPTARKIEQYSQDFPNLSKLNDLALIAAGKPEILIQAQPILEGVILQRVKTANNLAEIRPLLPSLQIAAQDRPEVLQKVEKTAMQNDPALSRALQPDLRALQVNISVDSRREEEKRPVAKKSHQDSTLQIKAQKVVAEKTTETERQGQVKAIEQAKEDQGAKAVADITEQERLKKETAPKMEQERRNKEIEKKETNTRAEISDNSIPRPAMVSVKGGTFEMGDVMDDKEYHDEKVHTVIVSDFLICRNEVTFEEYDRFCLATKRAKPQDEGWGRGQYPVINVSWEDAIAYCNWLSEQHSLQPVYSGQGNSIKADWNATGYRLPTEAEWEYAARSRGERVRFGNNKDMAEWGQINFNALESSKELYSLAGTYRKHTVPVGSLNSANKLGLHDMSGNVYEWCWDWYGESYYYSSSGKDPKGPSSGGSRVLRGGSCFSEPGNCRAANRGWYNPSSKDSLYGFRLVRR